MFEIIKSAILAGGYKLTEIQHKIKKLYILGDLTEEETDHLLAMASSFVSADAERPETLVMLRSLAEEIKALEDRVAVLEGGNSNTETETATEWKPWDGISKNYQKGAIVSHNGQLWESVYDGQNVWQPGTVGTENLWVKYTA